MEKILKLIPFIFLCALCDLCGEKSRLILAKKNANPVLGFTKRGSAFFLGAIFWVAEPVLPVPVYYNLGQAFLFQLNDARGQKDQ